MAGRWLTRMPGARGAPLLLGAILLACGTPAVGPVSQDYDAARAAQQARTFATIATSNTWGNYGQQFATFCTAKFGFDCNRPERSKGEDLLSAQEVQQWDAEKNNPGSVLADISILFIAQAEQAGVLAQYQPPNAKLIPDDMRGDGWIATFVGVPALLVNVDFLESRGLPIPQTWEDLTDPLYAGMVGLNRVGVSGGGTWAFVAMNLAAGGTLDDWQPGVDYGRRLLPNLTQQMSFDTFEKGEVPISVRYDFNHVANIAPLTERDVNFRIVIPSDGSVYAPSALMMNRYDTAHHDFAKMFMEWALTDEGQVLFGEFGARPIRMVAGDERVEVPAEVRANWLPDEAYANVRTVDFRKIDSDRIAEMWESEVVGGN